MADIILIIIIAFFAYRGAKRGFARTFVGVLSTFFSLIIGMIIYRPVSLWLYNSEFSDIVREYISGFFEKNVQGGLSLIINSQSNIEALTILSINAISFVMVILLSKIVVSFVARIINVTARLPVIKQANALLGMALGTVSGLLICYVIIGIVPLFGGQSQSVLSMIEKSFIASVLYDNNLITNVLTAFVK